jgi:4-amino-4-deoxy-L-arabinose transferase-like glycosyltransferase
MNDAGGAARREWATGAGLFLLSYAVRVLYVVEVSGNASVRFPILDSRAYHERALRILSGDWLGSEIFYQDPLYPYVLAGLYGAFGVGSIGVLLSQAFLDACTPVLVFAIALRVFDFRTAWLAGAIAALYKLFPFYDALLLKSSLSVFLITLTLYAIVRADALRRRRDWLAAGLLLGLACTTRGNYLLFAIACVPWLALRGATGSQLAPARGARLLPAGLVGLGFALAVAPVTLRNYAVAGDVVLITAQAGPNFYIGNHRDNATGIYKRPEFLESTPFHEEEGFRAEAERRSGRDLAGSALSRYWLRESLAEIADDPGHFARHLARKARLLGNAAEVPDNQSYAFFRQNVSTLLRVPLPTWGAVLPFAIWGIFASRRNRRADALLLYTGAYTLSLLLFYTTSRYRIPLAPAAIVFGSAGVWHVLDALRQRRAVAFAALAWLAVAYPAVHSHAYDESFARHRVNLAHRYQDRAGFQELLSRMYARAGDETAAEEARQSAAALNEQAHRELQRARIEAPQNSEVEEALLAHLVGRTRSLLRTGRPGEALPVARELTVQFPTHADGWILLGRAYEDLGQRDDAARAQRRALDLAPDDARAVRALSRLTNGEER